MRHHSDFAVLDGPTTKPRRNDVPVKIDLEVIRVAKINAAYKGQSLAEYLTEALRPLVTREHTRLARKASHCEDEADE